MAEKNTLQMVEQNTLQMVEHLPDGEHPPDG
jgi:hypothetical protein